MNPHSYFYLDVTDSKGVVSNWKFEGFPPNVLYRNRLEARCHAAPPATRLRYSDGARDGTNWTHSREVTFKDGKKLFFGPPAGTGDGGNVSPMSP